MEKYRVVIIDQDKIHVAQLKNILSEYCQNIEIIEIQYSLLKGIDTLNNKDVDIVFFGVSFDEGLVFDFVKKFNHSKMSIVLMDDVSTHAINAFSVNAVDFILKPINLEDIILAVNRATNRMTLKGLAKSKKTSFNKLGLLPLASMEGIELVKMNDILYCKADGRYTEFYLLDGRKIIASKNIGVYEELMWNNMFFRIHHSYIINVNHVLKIYKKDGSYCELTDGSTISIAKRKLDSFNKFVHLN